MKARTLQYLGLGTIFAALLIPLVVFPTKFIFPFIVPRVLFFRTMVVIGAAIALLLLHRREVITWNALKNDWLSLSVLFFIGSIIVSTFLGVDWYKSFWDNHERMLGQFTLVHVVAFFFLLRLFVQKKEEWMWVLRWFLFISMVVAFIGFVQKYLNPDYFYNMKSGRVSGTLGNAIYLGGLGVYMVFHAAILYVKERVRGWKYFAMAGAVLGVVAILVSGTRGSLLGVFVGLFVMLALYVYLAKDRKKKRIGLGVLIAILALGGLGILFRDVAFVKEIPAFGRLVNTQIGAGTSNTRFMAWGIAIDAWKERPLFGWGSNNFFIAFNKYYRPEFLRHGVNETWFDNAHNVVFNTLAERGLVGLVSYGALFLVPIIMLLQGHRKRMVPLHLVVLSSGFLAAHFTHNFFVFENPTSYVYFFLFLGYLHFETRQHHHKEIHFSGTVDSFRVGMVGLVALLVIFLTNIQPARANHHALKSIAYINQFHQEYLVTPQLKYATPHRDDVHQDLTRSFYNASVLSARQGKSAEQVIGLAMKGLESSDAVLAMHPLDIRIHFQRAQLLQFLSQVTGERKYLEQADQIMMAALSLSPQRQHVLYLSSLLKHTLGQSEEAERLLQQAIDADPTIGEGYWRMAFLYIDLGREKEALALLTTAEEKGYEIGTQGEQLRAELEGKLNQDQEE